MSHIRTYALLGGIIIGICGLETTSQAQYYDVWGYCDFWDSGDSLFGGCDAYDNSTGCLHTDYLHAGNLLSPTRNSPFQTYGWSNYTSLPLDSEFGEWTIGADFLAHCSCINEYFTFPVQAVQNVQPWPIPEGEYTEQCGDGWAAETVGLWCMTLVGTGGNFYGRLVQEFASGTGSDTCNERVSNSSVPALVQPTGGPPGGWNVSQSNFWGADAVGWGSGAVSYYRGYGVEPCGAAFNQSMRINQRGGGWVEYVVNTLAASIGTSTVHSWRAGIQAQRVWPE